jgi:hypothetical protein
MNKAKALGMCAGAASAFFVLMAFVHTPQGLALWGRLRGSQSCPYGMDGHASPAERDARRAAETEALRGVGRATSVAFLGFELNKTTRTDVDVWARAQGIQCRPVRTSISDLECSSPKPAGASVAQGEPSTFFFVFNRHGALKSIHAMTDYADAEAATAAFAQLRQSANTNFGAHFSERGEASAAYLSAGVLRQVTTEYRLHDVFARLIATRLASSYVVEQKYRALID